MILRTEGTEEMMRKIGLREVEIFEIWRYDKRESELLSPSPFTMFFQIDFPSILYVLCSNVQKGNEWREKIWKKNEKKTEC